MRFFSRAGAAALLSASTLINGALAQLAPWTHPESGIEYQLYTAPQGMKIGFVLPGDAMEETATEIMGYFECPAAGGEDGWCGISLGGSMRYSLLLVAHPYEEEVYTSLQWAVSYDYAEPYTGDDAVTSIVSSTVNDTHFTVEWRCQDCLTWSQGGDSGGVDTTSGFMLIAWAQANEAPGNAACPTALEFEQHDRQGLFGLGITEDVVNDNYAEWAELAEPAPEGECDGTTPPPSGTDSPGPSGTEEPAPPETGIPVPDDEYDYVIVGAGAGGIPLADKLSEAGHSVLLIEKGPPSTARWGGTRGPAWLEGEDLTRFDVPGLCNQIWVDSAGIACRDTDQMAGCVLGGGTAVNAGLWWRPYAEDWDYIFPQGWKADDMADAEERVFARIPGTTVPSQDGELYLTDGMDVLREGLRSAGWDEVDLNENPNEKNHTFGHTPYMFEGGERGGPLATYLVTANERPNFTLWTGTAVRRVIREGGHVTGVEVEPFLEGGYEGVVPLTAVTGRVVLSAGTFGSAKVLFRSGIGPEDQLEVVAASSIDGDSMIDSDQWINLPVGYNLEDHVNTNTVLRHPSVQFYDFYEAWDGEPEYVDDISKYLSERAGILAQAAPNIGPLFFDEITGADGIVRQLQWTARMEASEGEDNGDALTISQYLGRGATSRGRMTITSGLNTRVTTDPYLRDDEDVEAVIKGIENLQAALAGVEDLEWLHPSSSETAREYVENMVVSSANRRANHWIGTNKMGTRDGRNNGDAVVDTDTRVYGTDNLFVVDASVFPGMITTNPSSYIVTVAEHAAQRIMQRGDAKASGPWEQCGGREWTGSFQCSSGLRCVELNPYYFQCQSSS